MFEYAITEARILITCDRGFEQRCYQWQSENKPHASVLYFDMASGGCRDIGLIVSWVELISTAGDWEAEHLNHFWRAK